VGCLHGVSIVKCKLCDGSFEMGMLLEKENKMKEIINLRLNGQHSARHIILQWSSAGKNCKGMEIIIPWPVVEWKKGIYQQIWTKFKDTFFKIWLNNHTHKHV
jgi:hypothetical protein